MKRFFRHPLFFITLVLLLAYVVAEIVIRGNALNQVSCGIGGYLFWGGIVLLGYCWIILPIIRFTTFPKWVNPETLVDPCEQTRYLEKMGKYYVGLFAEKRPPEIADAITELKQILQNPRIDAADYRDGLLRLVPEIHRQLSETVCDRIVRDYMKKTAVLVCVSQRGWLDSLAMLVMQIRMIIDLSRSLGYRPSWIFILYCIGWIMVNSIVFVELRIILTAPAEREQAIPMLAVRRIIKGMMVRWEQATVMSVGQLMELFSPGAIVPLARGGNPCRFDGTG